MYKLWNICIIKEQQLKHKNKYSKQNYQKKNYLELKMAAMEEEEEEEMLERFQFSNVYILD